MMLELLEVLAGGGPKGVGDALLALLVATVGLLAPTFACLLRPMETGHGKRFWVSGALCQAVLHGGTWLFGWGNAGVLIATAALAVAQWFVLRQTAASRHRLAAALVLEAVLSVVLYIGMNMLLILGIAMSMYG